MNRNLAIEPPAGYKWHLRTHMLIRDALGCLELWRDDVTISARTGFGSVGKGKHEKTVFPVGSEYVHRPNQVRRLSKRIVREHNAALDLKAHRAALAAAVSLNPSDSKEAS